MPLFDDFPHPKTFKVIKEERFIISLHRKILKFNLVSSPTMMINTSLSKYSIHISVSISPYLMLSRLNLHYVEYIFCSYFSIISPDLQVRIDL